MLIPATRYRDCEAALAFVTNVLGLVEHAVYRDDAGSIVHAQIRLGRGLMMFGPPNDGSFDDVMTDPALAGGVTTSIYVVVDDLAVRYAQVVAAGAEIVMPLEDQSYGGASFSLRDPEGHIWTLGDYDPMAAR
ncbi:VOC family protein [Sedimentitalea todarodis]|uniref:VOC family protein n=1 Tax=Sedimentitalea todarodis TaxID=1631240 RepID=A0ABU3VC69_9RHOB|nr:VOC family protein [Sedimentitalea todarodis]MDU9003768.1 VOC family protein [Sedimentitalea todarodis]